MGIHTGTAQAEVQKDLPGGYDGYLTLTLVQRVISAAHGGQVLLSNTSTELARGQLELDVTLRDLGEHRLKGLVKEDVRKEHFNLQSWLGQQRPEAGYIYRRARSIASTEIARGGVRQRGR